MPAPQPQSNSHLPPANPNLAMFAQMMAQRFGMTPPNMQNPNQPPPFGGGQGQPPMGGGQPGMMPPTGGMPPPPMGGQPGQPSMGQMGQMGQPGQQPGMPPQQLPMQGGMPGQPPQQGMPPGMPPSMPPGMPPGGGQPPGQPPGMPGQQGQQGGQQHRYTPQEMAALGRMGDSVVAHMTPGEISVPPQIQSPKVLATLKEAFKKKNVPPQNFVAGSPTESKNPATGAPEFSFWSSFLPIALGIGGSLIAPGIGTELGLGASSALMGAVGGGLGTTIGGLATGESPIRAGLSGLGAGAGGYLLGGGAGSLFGDSGGSAAASAGGQAGSQMAGTAATAGTTDPFGMLPSATSGYGMGGMGSGMGAGMAADSASQSLGSLGPTVANSANPAMASALNPTPSFNNLYGMMPGSSTLSGGLGAAGGSAIGGMIGNAIGAPPQGNPPNYPPGFTTPMTPVSQLPSFQQQLGYNTYNGPQANFNGFNPATNYPASYNFFPPTPSATS